MNISHFVHKKPEAVFAYLSDMQKFVGVHPIIYKMVDLGQGNYQVYERLPLGFTSFSFNYPVTVKSQREGLVVTMNADVMKLAMIEMKFVIEPDGDSSVVNETVQIATSFPLKAFIWKECVRHHTRLFKNIALAE